MSLATRCTACGTVFRVVQDQLKVSEGWVRCGRCAEVFDAREQLFDLEREAPPPWPRPPEPEPEPEPLDIALDDTGYGQQYPAPEPEDAEPLAASSRPSEEEATWEMREGVDGSIAPCVPGDETPPRRFASSQPWPPSELPPEPATADFAPISDERMGAPDITGLAADPDDSPHVPTFVRDAAKVRAPMTARQGLLWGGAGLLLTLLLALQALFHFRDALAAQQPALAGPLQQLCQVLSCEIRPLQRIEALGVEGSSLTRVPNEAGTYRLAVTLRNRADAALALPSFELSLSDSAGALLVRKVLSPADFAASAPAVGNPIGTIAARSELSLQTQVRAGDTRLVGYTVEVFYP
ncbi:MAG: DUF3426 domain-containing protein [Burkholderiaceae bacterium]|nr:DUF3426 domain-containing protein [Burkholderiaceae bacterium]